MTRLVRNTRREWSTASGRHPIVKGITADGTMKVWGVESGRVLHTWAFSSCHWRGGDAGREILYSSNHLRILAIRVQECSERVTERVIGHVLRDPRSLFISPLGGMLGFIGGLGPCCGTTRSPLSRVTCPPDAGPTMLTTAPKKPGSVWVQGTDRLKSVPHQTGHVWYSILPPRMVGP
jgi:hypothetical protein